MTKVSNAELANKDSISSKSANKVLEILLHTMQGNISTPLNGLLADSKELNQNQREQLGQLKDSIDRMELIMQKALATKQPSSIEELNVIDVETTESLKVENILRSLATNTSSHNSEDFFKYCVKSLAELYNSRYAFIGLIKENKTDVRTLSVWAGDRHVDNFEYELEGTPCNDIITFNKELIPRDVRTLYPNDELLHQMGIDSYFGAPLITKDLGVIGVVSVMDTKPMQPDEWTSPVLSLFASRIALEVLRKHAVEKLVSVNMELEERVQKRTQELEALNVELKAFCYSVSHDLRAPVRAINSFIEIVFEDFFDQLPDVALHYLNRVKASGEKLDELITSMLSLSQVSRKDIVHKKINLSKLFANCFDDIQALNADRKIEIHIEPDIITWGDEGLLRIACENLSSNAWKYTEKTPKPIISIGTTRLDDNKVIYIKDNGDGLDMKYAQRLFQPFQRMHSPKEFEGIGIGLATTQKVVSRHDGKIWVEAEKGKGATFYFTLGDNKPIKE